ncbi:beta-ketoacyl-ACP synthase III [Streptomyces sp. NPDC017056]|uniref:beta-ketoacyl-ACP synthase III n=1 Tax=Streptomyces sp. NPDC017056 TaxID=3364973 RepID=UPI0037B60792
MTAAAVLCGLGTALPPRVVTNDDLAQQYDTSDQWIRARTGIQERRWVGEGVATSDLAVEAGQAALKSAQTDSVDLVVLCTTTPDHPCPATAPDVATRLGLSGVPAFDLAAVCSGFVYGLSVAAAHIISGAARQVLVIGAETYSRILSPEDRTTAVIFGDGAGAVVLRAGEPDEPGALLGFHLGSDGAGKDDILLPAGGARQRTATEPDRWQGRYFTMNGGAVYPAAVERMTASTQALLQDLAWSVESVNWFVGHQANRRILNAVADRLQLDREKVVIDLDRVGNTSAASIPLALARFAHDAAFTAGDRVVLTAFGGGFTWGASALRWPTLEPVSVTCRTT